MNRAGQIVSLDFLISIIAIVLALGILIQISELKTYDEIEEREWMELRQVSETAAARLVSNPELNCIVVKNGGENELFRMPNCLDITVAMARSHLAIPESPSYGFELSDGDGTLGSYGSRGNNDFIEVKRLMVTNSGNVDKSDYLNGVFDSGNNPIEVMLKVWKI